MNRFDEISIGDVGRALRRYQPFIFVVVGILLVVALLPGAKRTEVTTAGAGDLGTQTDSGDVGPTDAGADAGTAADGTTAAGASGGAPAGGATGAAGRGAARSPAAAAAPVGARLVANCDSATSRVKVPSKFAAPCVPAFNGTSGGASSKGVSGSTVKIAWYEVQTDAATQSVLTAAGANDSTEQVRQQVRDWIEFYSTHLQTYGRKIEVVFVPASGAATDDAAARADAIKIAEEIKAFAVMNAPATNVFAEELVARKVMCMCTVSQPIENYLRWAPYIWSNLAASSQMYLHRTEYVSRLARKPAKWAGDAVMREQPRKFGLLYYDTNDKAYRPGIDFFIKELNKLGIPLASVVEYHGYPDVARSQEEARPSIQKLVESGATSVICVCDPFGPIFMTQEATRQLYRPEWIVTGSALTDTSFFARLYDQSQWTQAFGVSALPARLPENLQDNYRLLRWHFGREPSAPAGYGVIRGPLDIFFNGVHMAGPKLTPFTFRDGLFAAPPAGVGGITNPAISYGRHGFWPWDDYLGFDDTTEIWWDETARGQDEIGGDGNGLYRYVDMGKRYLAGRWPRSDPKAFDPTNTITIYDKPPAADQWPDYPSPKR